MKYVRSIEEIISSPRPLVIVDAEICDPWKVPSSMVEFLQWTAPAYLAPAGTLKILESNRRFLNKLLMKTSAEHKSAVGMMFSNAAIIFNSHYFTIQKEQIATLPIKYPISDLSTYVTNLITLHFPKLSTVIEDSAMDDFINIHQQTNQILSSSASYNAIVGGINK